MNNRLNRKKNLFLKKKYFLIMILFLTLILLIYFFYYKFQKIENFFLKGIEKTSIQFNYTLQSYEIRGLNNVNKKEIVKIIETYLNSSIFLLPLNNIADKIYENNWIDKVEIKIDYKNKIFINIFEYKPIGIYHYNEKKYYFDSKGKIIDYFSLKNNQTQRFIIFKGKSSTMEAYNLIKILENSNLKDKILEAFFIKNRRWNLLLENDLLVKLSEINIDKSIENLFKLLNTLDKNDIKNIKVIDLRDYEKAILEYR
tara:strand:+ start:787 stop:1554 length:768 start_codon:yes stop_codon:yes gene_type:complete